MAEQAPVPESVTPTQFFEELLPMGVAAQVEAGATVPESFSMQYNVVGPGGGQWFITIADKKMSPRKGTGEALVTFTISEDDWRDAVLGRDGASISLILPQSRPGRPDNSGRVKTLKGTMALELAREGRDPAKIEVTFNGAAAPRTLVKMKLPEYVAMQEGRLNGQEAFMTGKMKIEGDLAFLMQIAALNA
jgi:hypothetical protein